MGLFDSLADIAGTLVGTIAGVAIAPIALALGVTTTAVKSAVDAGCRTQEEIKEFLDL